MATLIVKKRSDDDNNNSISEHSWNMSANVRALDLQRCTVVNCRKLPTRCYIVQLKEITLQ